jgi:DNA-binding transcriptional regulator YhcF (GntR family)
MFNSDRPIYLQMAERLCDEILSDIYHDDSRIPSVREYAVALGVNTNTAVKAYEELSRMGVIYNKRGLGYFVSPGAKGQIQRSRRLKFLKETAPELFRQMRLMGLGIGDLVAAWEKTSF